MIAIFTFYQWMLCERFCWSIIERENIKLFVELVTALGTIALGLLALFQNKRLGRINERLLRIEEMRLKPMLEIRNLTAKHFNWCDEDEIARESDLFSIIVEESFKENEPVSHFRLRFFLKNHTESSIKSLKLKSVRIDFKNDKGKTYEPMKMVTSRSIFTNTEVDCSILFKIQPKEGLQIFLKFDYLDVFDNKEVFNSQIYCDYENDIIAVIK